MVIREQKIEGENRVTVVTRDLNNYVITVEKKKLLNSYINYTQLCFMLLVYVYIYIFLHYNNFYTRRY